MKAHRGAVLIVVLGVLAVLALLALTFFQLQGMELRVSHNYLDTIRARLVARSGVEDVVMRLSAMASQNLIPEAGSQPWKYWGDNKSEEGSDLTAVELKKAKNPSFAVENDGNPSAGSPDPRQVTIEGKQYGFSGTLSSGTYALNGDIYTVKVTDSSGKLYINEGVTQYQRNESTGSQNIKRILNRLGEAMTPPINQLGDSIINSRPTSGYRSVDQLKSILGDATYDRVKDFLTAYAWVDQSVANPVPYSAAQATRISNTYHVSYYRGSGGTSLYRFGRGKNWNGVQISGDLQIYGDSSTFQADSLTHAIYGLDELNPVWIEITSRAPVNVNLAPKEVLVALLSDLKGVFMSDRRRNNLGSGGSGYYISMTYHTYDADQWVVSGATSKYEGDEIGWLYETYPILGPSAGSTAQGIRPANVADEIIACREKKKSASGIDYADAAKCPFGGPFRTWRQFYQFCDNLVAVGVLNDPRQIYYDYNPTETGTFGSGTPQTSEYQRKVACQAIADVIKANFNPNLHLNELNPDKNFFLLVDKTDLLVNSTEFIFTTTGSYDIEAIGRVLRPESGDDALVSGIDNHLMAEAEIRAGVKLFDLIRETNQSQFARGDCSSLKGTGTTTSSGRTLEVGPEPNNGKAPRENKWDGYIALPTYGGNGSAREPDVRTRTPQGSAGESTATVHQHMDGDFDPHYHIDGDFYRRDLGSNYDLYRTGSPPSGVQNYADPGEPLRGPYDPMDGADGDFRLARSFTLPPADTSGSQSMPTVTKRASEDLRIDGGYFERNAGLAWWMSAASFNGADPRSMQGTISFWVKPSFFPERSGKPRIWMDMTKLGSGNWVSGGGWGVPNGNFMCLWNAGHNSAVGTPPAWEDRTGWSDGDGIKPETLILGFGRGQYCGSDPSGSSLYMHVIEPPSLNHVAHNDNRRSLIKGHEWAHVVLRWLVLSRFQITVNGSTFDGTVSGGREGGYGSLTSAMSQWPVHSGGQGNANTGEVNAMCFGYCSRTTLRSPFMNFAADATLDEIYLWKSFDAAGGAISGQWTPGRYRAPASGEGDFTSQQIAVAPGGFRQLPPPSSATPEGTSPVPKPPGASSAAGTAKILGATWTVFADAPVRYYNTSTPLNCTWTPSDMTLSVTDDSQLPASLEPTQGQLSGARKTCPVELSIVDRTSVNATDDGYSPLTGMNGGPPEVTVGDMIRYRLTFKVNGGGLPRLLTTPYVDDVTLYVTYSQDLFTYYQTVVAN